MPFGTEHTNPELATDKANEVQPSLEEVRAAGQLDPAQAKQLEAMDSEALRKLLTQPDMSGQANAPVRGKVIEVLTARLGPDAVRDLLEIGPVEEDAAMSPRDQAVKVMVDRGLPENLIPKATIAFALDDDDRFTLTLSGRMQFEVDGKTIKFDEVITGIATEDGLEEIEGIKGKSGWFTAEVESIYLDGDELVIETSLKTVRVDKEDIPPF